MIYHPRCFRLTGKEGIGLREPPRPEHLRQDYYLERFDFHTIWFDAFRDLTGDRIVLIGPPMLNLEPFFKGGKLMCGNEDAKEVRWSGTDKGHQIWLRGGTAGCGLRFVGEGFERHFTISDNHSGTFEGRRVLLTMVKNDRLDWIRDWVIFHVENHGADGVLLYDNNSDAYSSEEILAALGDIEGLESAVVVRWFFPRGAGGGGKMPWDSDFAQLGGLEHAHHLFLSKAEAVLSCDVDELVVDREGESVFDLCKASPTGYLKIQGRWAHCFAKDGTPWPDDLRHRHHRWTEPGAGLNCQEKWVICPARHDPRARWGVHYVREIETYLVEGLEFRHCRGINTSWKYDRATPRVYDPAKYRLDKGLINLFGKTGWDAC